MGWENLLGYMSSALFTKHKVAKRQIFTAALQKDYSNPGKSVRNLNKLGNRDMKHLNNWVSANKISVNVEKT